MVVPTKGTRERLWSARGLDSKVTELLVLLGDSAEAHLGPDTRDPMLTVLEKGAGKLRILGADLLEAELAYLQELADDGEPRDRRGVLGAEVRGLLKGLRASVTAWWPPKEAASRSLTAVPDGNDQVLGMARAVLANWKPLPPSPLGATFDDAPVIENLRVKTEAYAGVLADVDREAAEASTALRRKREATGRFDRSLTLLARMTEALLRAAGEDDAADRLRPSMSRSGRTEAVASGLDPAPEELEVPVPAAEPAAPAPAADEDLA